MQNSPTIQTCDKRRGSECSHVDAGRAGRASRRCTDHLGGESSSCSSAGLDAQCSVCHPVPAGPGHAGHAGRRCSDSGASSSCSTADLDAQRSVCDPFPAISECSPSPSAHENLPPAPHRTDPCEIRTPDGGEHADAEAQDAAYLLRIFIKELDGRFPGVGAPACEHYDRNCYLKCSSCQKYHPCRRCHDENEPDHEFQRRETELVACSSCGAEDQPAVQDCGNCQAQFAAYFCEVCRFYDDAGDGQVYHCEDCGICRVGRREDNFHCDRCGSCVPKDVKDSHPCMEDALDRDCPICLEYMASSTDQVVYMKCGHAMHGSCFDQYTERSYTCPLCHKSLADMSAWYKALEVRIAEEKLPWEYAKRRTLVSCHDCGEHSTVPFHFQYRQCGMDKCRGFNTFVVSEAQDASEEEVEKESLRRAAVLKQAFGEAGEKTPDKIRMAVT